MFQPILRFLHLCFSPRWWRHGDPGLQHALSTTAGSALPQPLNVAPSYSLSPSSSSSCSLPTTCTSPHFSLRRRPALLHQLFGTFEKTSRQTLDITSFTTREVTSRPRPSGILLWEKTLGEHFGNRQTEISLFIYNKPPRRELTKEALMTF